MFVVAGTGVMPIIGGTPAEATLKELVEFSQKKENWFQNPDESAEAAKKRTDPRPKGGHHASHARHITVKDSAGEEHKYSIVFTITQGQLAPKGDLNKIKTVLLRHATLAVGGMSRPIGTLEAFTILRFLGFKTGFGLMQSEHPDFEASVFLEPLSESEEQVLRAQQEQSCSP